jgi:hypothetical protein
MTRTGPPQFQHRGSASTLRPATSQAWQAHMQAHWKRTNGSIAVCSLSADGSVAGSVS